MMRTYKQKELSKLKKECCHKVVLGWKCEKIPKDNVGKCESCKTFDAYGIK